MSPCPSSNGEMIRANDFPGSPVPSFPGTPAPNPYRTSEATTIPPLTKAFVTPALLTQYGRWYPELLRRQGWERSSAQRAYTWALSNPRTALLLLLCEDIASWPKAVIFGLEDEKMPYLEADLQGIAANPKKAVEMQWRVTAKELPQNGLHAEFQARETVPLQQINVIRSSGSEKSVDRVRLLGEQDERVLVRKRFIYSRPSQKQAILNQIQEFKKLEHKNIARLACSYSQGNVIGIVTSSAQYSLDDYLQLPLDPNRPKLLLDWINDLCQAMDYLHSMQMSHRSVRPRKILVEGSRVFFASFGISCDGETASPPKRMDQSYFSDQSYIYAAPEVITPRGKKVSRPADVFSLGCIFLAMMTVVKGQSLSTFHAYRASSTHDASFHANLDRVSNWRMRLQAISGPVVAAQPQRREQAMKIETSALEYIETMIRADPSKRIKMRRLAAWWSEAKSGAGLVRRRSLDGMNSMNGMNGLNGLNGISGLNGMNGMGGLNGLVGLNGLNGINMGRTDLGQLEGYYNQRRHEDAATTWGAK